MVMVGMNSKTSKQSEGDAAAMKIVHTKQVRHITYAIATLLPLLGNLMPVQAEGGDARGAGSAGVNRRVLSNTGYAEVSGTFDMNLSISTGAAWRSGQDIPSPSFYFGGHGNFVRPVTGYGDVEVDAGLQYDRQIFNSVERGWWVFIRNSNTETKGNPNEAYCSLKYWDPVAKTSLLWTSGTNAANPLGGIQDVYLNYTVHEADDPATGNATAPLVEQAGWMSLTFDGLRNVGVGANLPRSTIYWNTGASTQNVTTTVQSWISNNSVKMSSVIGLEEGQPVTIGTGVQAETRNVLRIDPGTNDVTIDGTFNLTHNAGDPVVQTLSCRIAYPNHPTAAWYGTQVFASSAADRGTWQVKRVIAMTRGTKSLGPPKVYWTEELNGSSLSCQFQGGMVKNVGVAAPHYWGSADVEQTKHANHNDTGYDAPETGNKAYDQRRSTATNPLDATHPFGGVRRPGISKPIVEFPNIDGSATDKANARKLGSEGATEGGNSRYTRETVNINLRMDPSPAAPAVAPVQPPAPVIPP